MHSTWVPICIISTCIFLLLFYHIIPIASLKIFQLFRCHIRFLHFFGKNFYHSIFIAVKASVMVRCRHCLSIVGVIIGIVFINSRCFHNFLSCFMVERNNQFMFLVTSSGNNKLSVLQYHAFNSCSGNFLFTHNLTP